MNESAFTIVPSCSERNLSSPISDTFGCCQLRTKCAKCTRPGGCVVSINRYTAQVSERLTVAIANSPVSPITKPDALIGALVRSDADEGLRRFASRIISRAYLAHLRALKGNDPTGVSGR